MINTILSLQDNMSSPLKAVSKTVKMANQQLESAKEQVKKYESVMASSNKSIDEAKSTIALLTKEYDSNAKQIESAKATMEKYSNTVGLSEKQVSSYNSKVEEARERLNSLEKAQESNSEATKTARDAINSQEQVLNKNSVSLQKARAQVREHSKSISENTKKVNEAKKKIEEWGKSAISSMDKVIKRSAQVGSVFAVATAGIAIKTGFGEAMDMEGYRMQLETATKDTEKAAERMRSAVEFANSTPFETGEVVEATATLEAMGVSSERWLKDIADMAGGTNKGMLQATEAMIDARKGEYERLKQFGIDKEMLMAEAAIKYGKNVVFNKKGQVKDREKMETILQETMQKKFAGGAEKQAKTLKGLMSTVTGVTKSALSSIVGMTSEGTIVQGSMFDMLKGHIESVVEVLNKWQKDGTIQMIAEQVTNAVGGIIEFFSYLFNFISEHKKLIGGILVFVGTIYAVIKALAILKTIISVVSVVMMVLNGTIVLSPLGWFVIGIATVATALYLLWDHLDSIVQMFKDVFSWIKNLLDGFGDFAFMLGGPILGPILLLIQHFEKISEVASKAWGYIKSIFGVEDKEISLDVKKDENLSINQEKKNLTFDATSPVGGVGNYSIPELKFNNKPLQAQTFANGKGANKQQAQINKPKTEINVTITGDVYGFNDFKEKVAEAFVKIYDQNKGNVV
ncbi:MAG: hypothetical protein ACRCXY_03600 [Fusobacteriaceae bacterium]